MGFNIEHLIETAGYIGLFAIIFAESGLFFGFFLPGDSLLLTAGLLAWKGHLDLNVLLPLLFVAAVLGDNVGYWFGKKVGPPLFNREASLLFRRKNLLAAEAFYAKHGGKAIVLARFAPFIRTFVPIVAGAVQMEYRRFFLFNVLGGFLWTIGLTLLGYTIGNTFGHVEGISSYIEIFILGIIALSLLPAMIHAWREYRHEIFAAVRARFDGA
jgi:membrane-associated protein